MYTEICERCKYQSYFYLSKHDTVCPFMYDFGTCYAYTRGDENKIDAYALIVESKIKERIQEEEMNGME